MGQRLIQHYAIVGDDGAALTCCQRLLALEPYSEEIYRQSMRLLARNGQRTAALQHYARCRQLLAEELAVAPDAETTALYEQIRQGAFPLAAPQPPATDLATARPPHQQLPLPTTPFVGRAAELAQLTALLGDPTCRLITLVGPGGIGKTRLALQAAALLTATPATPLVDGIFFIAATAVTRLDALIAPIARALGLSFSGQLPTETQLLNHLHQRRLLLLLDNFEQLVPEAATLATWLQQAPGLRLLITSRERLNLYDEWLFPVEGLPVPAFTPGAMHGGTAAELAHYGATALFVQRARRVNLGFSLAHEAANVAAICTRLHGHPLAIELAAGWVRTHSCAEILREIERNLDFLATSLRDRPERHHSLRAAFAHSWALLTAADAAVYRRLALLRGGFTPVIAHALTGTGQAALARLVDKSLVQRAPDARYTIHELLRQYAVQQLTPSEEWETLAAYCRYLAQWPVIGAAWRETAREAEMLAALEAEIENLRVAWRWLTEQLQEMPINDPLPDQQTGGLTEIELCQLAAQLSSGVTYFFLRRSRYQEGRQWLTSLRTALQIGYDARLSNPAAGLNRSTALACASIHLDYAEVIFHQSQFAEVATMGQSLCTALRRHAAPHHLATALTILGKTYVRLGRYREAETVLQESLALYQHSGADKASAAVHNALGILYSNQGHFTQAEAHYRACLAIFATHGYQRGLANISNNLGSNFARNGNYAQALPLYTQSYALAQAIGETLMIAIALSNMGAVSCALGDYPAAEEYYAQSLAHCRAIGERRWTAAGLNGLGLTRLAQERFAEAYGYYVEALTIAQEIESKADVLDALAGLGEITLHGGNLPQAAAILHFVSHHPITQRPAQQRSQRLLAQLFAQLSPTEQAAVSRPLDGAAWQAISALATDAGALAHRVLG
jgi:predicted ATPase/Tfp pilus assembly protein PilF